MFDFATRIPPEFDSLYKSSRGETGILKAIREFQSNAKNYGATKSVAFVGRNLIDGEMSDQLWYSHNGIGFESMQDLLESMQPGRSGKTTEAFNGLGLSAAAWLNCSNSECPFLVVGGRINDELKFVKVYAVWETNELKIEEAPEFVAEFTRLVGKNLIVRKMNDKYDFNVIYGIKLTPLDKVQGGKNAGESVTPLTMAAMATLPMLSQSLFNNGSAPELHYCQNQIGFSEKKVGQKVSRENLQEAWTPTNGWNVGGAEGGQTPRSSSKYRRVYPHSEYVNRFRLKPYVLPIKGVVVSCEEDVEVTVDGEVTVSVYPNYNRTNTKDHDSTGGCNIRDFEADGRDGSAGRSNEGGYAPILKAVMAMSIMNREAQERDPPLTKEMLKAFARFEDNAMVSYQQIGTLASLLGLNYNSGPKAPAVDLSEYGIMSFGGVVELPGGEKCGFTQKPFLTIEIKITNIYDCRNVKTGAIDYTARQFVGNYGRTADFWLGDKTKAHILMQLMVESAAPVLRDLYPEAIELSKKLWPVEESERCKIHLGGKTDDRSLNHSVFVYQVDGEEELIEGKLENVRCGAKHLVVLQDQISKRLIPYSELSGDSACRGVTFFAADPEGEAENVSIRLQELSRLLKVPVNEIPVITVRVEGTKLNGVPIPKDEWVANNVAYSPSRNISAKWIGPLVSQRVYFGTVDLPKADKGHGKGGGGGGGSGIAQDFEPTCRREPGIRFGWRVSGSKGVGGKIFPLMNIDDPWGKKYWDRPCVAGSPLDKALNAAWFNLQEVTQSIYEVCIKCKVAFGEVNLPEVYHTDSMNKNGTKDEGDAPYDYLINQALEAMIFSKNGITTEIQKLFEKIDGLLPQEEMQVIEAA